VYFWRIARLIEQLRRGPLEQRAALLYILAWLVLWTALTLSPVVAQLASSYPGDWASFLVILVSTVLGTLAAYSANGGAHGSDFAARYFAIGWVLAIRLIILLLLPLFVLFFIVAGVLVAGSEGQEPSEATSAWIGAGLTIVFEIVYYWRLMHHFRSVTAPSAESASSAV
jgi:hypothetical protein